MDKRKTEIVIFEIFNEQQDYAACLDFIKMYGERNFEDEDRGYKEYIDIIKAINVYYGMVYKGVAPRYLEEPLSIPERNHGEGVEEKHIISERQKFSENDWKRVQKDHKDIKYYLRIDMKNVSANKDQLINLQYLALLLKRFKEWNNVENKGTAQISVFIVPSSGQVYPFDENGEFDENTYRLVSQYLRLIANEYKGVLFGAKKELGKVVVKSFDFKKDRKYEEFFPLTIINDDLYKQLFNRYLSAEDYEWILAKRKNSRYGDSRNTKPEKALRDIIVETSIRRLEENVEYPDRNDEDRKKMLENIISVIKGNNGYVMQFSLFSFIMRIQGIENKDQLEKYIRDVWRLSGEICHGIRQIVQNSIQHSEFKECFFSFCLHQNRKNESNEEFVKRIQIDYPETNFKESDAGTMLEGLEVFISDLNEKSDMIQKFANTLEEEKNINASEKRVLDGHEELYRQKDYIAIRNFFSEFAENDKKTSWYKFRSQDLAGHVGLSLFAVTAKRCEASVKVISSKKSYLESERNYFYKSYSSKKNNEILDENQRVIPGTQFSILIPIQKWELKYNGEMGKLSSNKYPTENYAGFADFIQNSIKSRHIVPENQKNEWNITKKEKYEWVQRWTRYWIKHISENLSYLDKIKREEKREIQDGLEKGIRVKKDIKIIFYHDLSAIEEHSFFASEDSTEVFAKGLIQALNIVNECKYEYYLAITNVPEELSRILREICIVLCVRKFPQNLQLYLCEKNCENSMIFLGDDFTQIINNSYIISLEQGVKGFEKSDCERALDLKKQLEGNMNRTDDNIHKKALKVCPFDVLLPYGNERKTIFEKRIEQIAERPLDCFPAGYKLSDTHMRLGSKVHLEAFYEMSFLFYRTTIANRIALLILDHLESNKIMDLENDNIIFYGYASYSKAILTSITEILREYRKKWDTDSYNVAFASYQHNLRQESEKVQMFFALPEGFPGHINEDNKLNISKTIKEKEVKLIQIVPISSTLTTFEKMLKMFGDTLEPTSKEKVHLCSNYTFFWVVDIAGEIRNNEPSEIEKKYRESIVYENKTVKTKLLYNISEKSNEKQKISVNYFINVGVKWHDPLECKLCYPGNMIEELPLVETDPTSTVPAQQIRQLKDDQKNCQESQENLERLFKLKGCVFYGHIHRRQNHYQYYLDTQKYFYVVKKDVMEWLKKQKKQEMDEAVMHVIFSPEHNTNVGFAQYVNTYYFNGMAEIVSFNVDKQFRSNFQCEHAALKTMITKLHKDSTYESIRPVRFYFVDDTIITGETFRKANSFLQSLIPQNEHEKYPANLFEKVFLLIDRLSDDTKQTYVEKIKGNFLSFLHIDVSNVRTQGDSCIGCKLEQNARRMFKRSATRRQAAYWANKIKSYRSIAYDDKKEMGKIDTNKSFKNLLVSHVLQNVIIKQNNSFCLGKVYDVLLNICLWMLMDQKEWENYCQDNHLTELEKQIYGYRVLLEEMRNIEGIETILKMSSRPFFAYDFKVKLQVLTLYISLTELLLGRDVSTLFPDEVRENKWKGFLFQENRIICTEQLVRKIGEQLSSDEERVSFIMEYLFEGLTDMGSTYLMRKSTMTQVYGWLEESLKEKISESIKKDFWKNYSTDLYKLIANNTDETKELWLEYLYLCGNEYQTKESLPPCFLTETIAGDAFNKEEHKYFYQFCHDIFLQNTGINFDNIEKELPQKTLVIDQRKKDYQLDYWTEFRKLDQRVLGQSNISFSEEEKTFFDMIKGENTDKIDEWYKDFLLAAIAMVHRKYGIDENQINAAILIESMDPNDKEEKLQRFDIVKEVINRPQGNMPLTKYKIKSRIEEALKQKDNNPLDLEENGYIISELTGIDKSTRPYIIIFFDNPDIEGELYTGRRLKKLARVYLYISIGSDISGVNENNIRQYLFFVQRYILRDMLTYRNRILRCLERDFSGNIFARYARTTGEKNILSHEKANSHNTTADDEVSIEIFMKPALFEGKQYKELTELEATKWLLLRNYTNGQIAKIFNRSFSDSGELVSGAPQLYLKHSGNEAEERYLFKQKLQFFQELELESDKRFTFLQEIVVVEGVKHLRNAEFIQSEEGRGYNQEYFKCILIDICMSAIKAQTYECAYLSRIERHLCNKKMLENLKKQKANKKERNNSLDEKIERYEKMSCRVIFSREQGENEVDYLVVKNPVDIIECGLIDWKQKNRTIEKRLHDPLDFVDGHMSLLAIKRYIENLNSEIKDECSFRYIQDGESVLDIYFETKLPVLKKERRSE